MELFKKLKTKYIKLVLGAPARRALMADSISSQNRYAILGDIHANLEALNAVLVDAEAQGVSQFICTGDVVGYGANPSECLKIIRELNCPVVLGNHDSYAATDDSLKDFNLNAMNAILWTREHLSADERQWLQKLHLQVDLATKTENENNSSVNSVSSSVAGGEKITLVHSSLQNPTSWPYIMKPEKAEAALRAQGPELVFFGHTHVPSVYSYNPETDEFAEKFPAQEGIHQLESGWKYLINPGSVGQPRDRDCRASYALYDPEAGTVEIRRIEYDISLVQKKIEAAGLPLRNAERLEQGR